MLVKSERFKEMNRINALTPRKALFQPFGFNEMRPSSSRGLYIHLWGRGRYVLHATELAPTAGDPMKE